MRDNDRVSWRVLAQYPDYEASTQGQIRRIRDGKILRPVKGRGWVQSVVFPEPHVLRSLHRLIAVTYLGPCPERYQVKFRDGNQWNCAAGNLFYAPPTRSTTRSTKGGLQKQHGQRVTLSIWDAIMPHTERLMKKILLEEKE